MSRTGTASPSPSSSTRTGWLSQAEAAEHLGITDRSLRRYVAEGRIPAYRLGNRLTRFRQVDLDAALRPIPAGGAQRAS